MGVPTYLSEYFICNPETFLVEKQKIIDEFGMNQDVYVHANAILTTPFDVFLNRIKELARADKAHGSVGLGINETIERNEQVRLRVGDWFAYGKQYVHDQLVKIRHNFILLCQDIPHQFEAQYETLISDAYMKGYLDFMQKFIDSIYIVYPYQVKSFLENFSLVFEGAQGLMLDEHFGTFPHVTRSRTGSINIRNILRNAGKELDETIYVTRCYSTRHGNGPFKPMPLPDGLMNIDDPTNYPNLWQGSMRFACIDIEALSKFIELDKIYCASKTRSMCVTCLDQGPNGYKFNDLWGSVNEYGLLYAINHSLHMDKYYVSHGPTVNDIQQYNDHLNDHSKFLRSVVDRNR